KKATVWSSEASQLKSLGAIYTGKPVERDGLIITANGPQAAKKFGETILATLGL
ncbi:MAG: DJ-1/PfpI family protein, partial [Candidatus Desulfofervidus sp.]|nr:DJ-1/PfpI family protein [Candidatus Desulfofervidus sp.]